MTVPGAHRPHRRRRTRTATPSHEARSRARYGLTTPQHAPRRQIAASAPRLVSTRVIFCVSLHSYLETLDIAPYQMRLSCTCAWPPSTFSSVHSTADCAAAVPPQQNRIRPRAIPCPWAIPRPPIHAAACLLLRSNEPTPPLTPASSSLSNGWRPHPRTPHRGLSALFRMYSLVMAKTSLAWSTRANSA